MSLVQLEAAIREAFKDPKKVPLRGKFYAVIDDKIHCCGLTSIIGKAFLPTTRYMRDELFRRGIDVQWEEVQGFISGWDGLEKYKGTPAHNLGASLWKSLSSESDTSSKPAI